MSAERALERLNALSPDEAEAELLQCCGSRAWAREVALCRPFGSVEGLLDTADAVWRSVQPEDWLEAFRSHPRIGERAHEGGGRHARWSAQEQAGLAQSQAAVLERLAAGNRRYEQRFGHIFLIDASGKSAPEILAALERRLHNDAAAEIAVAAEEQRRITQKRLRKLLES